MISKHNIFAVNEKVDEKLKKAGSGVLIPVSITDEHDVDINYLIWVGFNEYAYCDYVNLKELLEGDDLLEDEE